MSTPTSSNPSRVAAWRCQTFRPIGALARRSPRLRLWEPLLWLALLASPLVVPQHAAIVNEIAIVALFAVSLDLVLGYTGIVSLGHAAFFGFGAYAAAMNDYVRTELRFEADLPYEVIKALYGIAEYVSIHRYWDNSDDYYVLLGQRAMAESIDLSLFR